MVQRPMNVSMHFHFYTNLDSFQKEKVLAMPSIHQKNWLTPFKVWYKIIQLSNYIMHQMGTEKICINTWKQNPVP